MGQVWYLIVSIPDLCNLTYFRHLKEGIQEFHRRFVLAPAGKAANNVAVV